jgi:hypothetical protein
MYNCPPHLGSVLCNVDKIVFSIKKQPGNAKGGSITVQLTCCLTGLEAAA